MLKFSEFWMLICFAHFGIDIGQFISHFATPIYEGPITLWGAVIGLFMGVLLLPVTNETARANFKKLLGC